MILAFSYKKTAFITFLFFLAMFSFAETGSDKTINSEASKIDKIYKRRLLGDKAFNDGLYDVAIKYYKQYLKNAGGDTSAVRNAYYCLISTCLKADNIKEAEYFYNKIKKLGADFYSRELVKKEKLNYWHNQILLAKGLNRQAAKNFSRIAKNTKNKDPQTYISALISQGITEIRLKNWEKAESIFRKVKENAPQKSDRKKAAEQLIIINTVSGDIKTAEKLLKKEAENYPDTPSIQLLRVYTLIEQNKMAEAETEYKKVSNKISEADNPIAFLVLLEFAEKYRQNKEYSPALNKFQLAFEKAPSLYEKELIAISTLNTLIEANKYRKAEASSKLFLDFFPNSILRDRILLLNIKILVKLEAKPEKVISLINENYKFEKNPGEEHINIAARIGKILFQIKKYQSALKFFSYVYKNSISRNQCGKGIYWTGKCYIELGKENKALEQFKSIDSKIPEWEYKAMLETALIFIHRNHYREAIEVLKTLLKNYPGKQLNPPPLYVYAEALAGNNELSLAVEKFIIFAESNKNSKLAPKAYRRAGDLNLRLQNFESAIKCYKKIVNLYPESKVSAESLYKLLYSYYLSGGYNKAIKAVDELNKKYPESDYAVQASFWLINYYLENKKIEAALDQLDRLYKKNADNKRLLNKILLKKAEIYFSMQKYAKAFKIIDSIKSVTKDSDLLAEAFYLEGDIYSENKNFDNAIESYKKVLNFKNQNDLAIAAQGRIGDCYFAVINFSDDKDETINMAVRAYKELLKRPSLSSFIKSQTYYKLGKCCELLKNKAAAEQYYYEALYGNALGLDCNTDAEKEWMAKAGIALSNLLQKDNTEKSDKAAINIYKTLIKYNIEPVSSFRNKIKILQKR
ncbi:MAG: tetratricopeptide repeat protein [Victivallales bacterium]|nr:tetratricopeptide repeat protein [Victivallales bacterium]